MNVFKESVQIEEWPIKEIGEEKFMGYIVSMRMIVINDDRDFESFVDFEYNDNYNRYQLPFDENLIKQLSDHLAVNMFHGSINKLWVKKTRTGWEVFLP